MSADAPQAALRHFGSGWISGTLSVTLGGVGLAAVFCFQFPSYLTLPEARPLSPPALIRAVLHLVLVGGFVLGFASVMLRQNKTLGLIGMGHGSDRRLARRIAHPRNRGQLPQRLLRGTGLFPP